MITINKIRNKNLARKEKLLINKERVKDWGEKNRKDFNKDFEPNTLWFFVRDNKKIVSFGCLRPISIVYLGVKYNIFGVCSILSIKKGKGYGRILISSMIKYAKKTGKTLLGFTLKAGFFKKAGLKIKKNFVKRFIYKNPKTGKEIIDDDGDGLYLNGKDNFIKKVLSNKSKVYIDILYW